MRDPNRIKPMLRLLERVWTKHPNLRLGQLIENATVTQDAKLDLYYIEDDELTKGLTEFEKL